MSVTLFPQAVPQPGFRPASASVQDLEFARLSDAELLSLASDGELPADQHAAWARIGAQPQAADVWQSHLLIGQTLRAQRPRLRGEQGQSAWMDGLRVKLAAEAATSQPLAPAHAAPQNADLASTAQQQKPAANDRFWKLVAGGSSMFAVAALSLSAVLLVQSPTAPAPELAQVLPQSVLPAAQQPSNRAAPVLAQASGNEVVLRNNQGQVMIQDKRLMERMMQHRQFGEVGVHGSSAFVRNATFER
jgi:hypothetical protein